MLRFYNFVHSEEENYMHKVLIIAELMKFCFYSYFRV